ncbi:MAG: hypothetical protein AB7T37_07480 [Dehalococcoidia bacterium]
MTRDDSATFWDHVAPLLASGQAEHGTIMGGGCLRVRGEFLAVPYHKGPGLVVKLPRQRVAELITAGRGQSFAPAGRVFREWLHVPAYDPQFWTDLLSEGMAFVSGVSK